MQNASIEESGGRARSVADARRLHGEGVPALFIGMENGFPIGTDLARIQEFYDRGIRYMTLTHSGDNQIGASSGGRTIATRATRDITDDMLTALAENGGVIQLVVLDSFLKDPPAEERQALEALASEYGTVSELPEEKRAEYMTWRREISRQYAATIEDFLLHFEHAVAVAGIDHVGFGSDFDGGGGITGLDDVTALPRVTEELLRRGYSERDIKKFWGGNLMRVLEAVESAAGK